MERSCTEKEKVCLWHELARSIPLCDVLLFPTIVCKLRRNILKMAFCSTLLNGMVSSRWPCHSAVADTFFKTSHPNRNLCGYKLGCFKGGHLPWLLYLYAVKDPVIFLSLSDLKDFMEDVISQCYSFKHVGPPVGNIMKLKLLLVRSFSSDLIYDILKKQPLIH